MQALCKIEPVVERSSQLAREFLGLMHLVLLDTPVRSPSQAVGRWGLLPERKDRGLLQGVWGKVHTAYRSLVREQRR